MEDNRRLSFFHVVPNSTFRMKFWPQWVSLIQASYHGDLKGMYYSRIIATFLLNTKYGIQRSIKYILARCMFVTGLLFFFFFLPVRILDLLSHLLKVFSLCAIVSKRLNRDPSKFIFIITIIIIIIVTIIIIVIIIVIIIIIIIIIINF